GVARLRDDRLDDGGLLLAPAPRLPPAHAGDQLGEIALRRVAIPHRDARHHVARRGPLGGQPGSRGRPARGIRAGLARGLAILRRASLLLDFSAGRRRRPALSAAASRGTGAGRADSCKAGVRSNTYTASRATITSAVASAGSFTENGRKTAAAARRYQGRGRAASRTRSTKPTGARVG